MIEKVYFTNDRFVEINIPDAGAVGVLISGGADSALLAYILADIVQRNRLKTRIFPITAELLSRPFNLKHSSKVLLKITELTGFNFDLHLCFTIPNHRQVMSDEQKIAIKSLYTAEFINRYELKTIFNGLTTNPPESALPSGPRSHRHSERDSDVWKNEMKKMVGLSVPFIEIDKRAIGFLFYKLNLLETLLPLTRSCEGDFLETHYCTKDCFDVRPAGDECWWCRERQYGFSTFI